MLSQYQKFVFGGAKLFALMAAVGFFSTIAGATQNPEQQARSLNAQPIKMAWAAASPRLADSESCAPHCAADFPDYWHLYLAANNGEEAAVEGPSLLRVPAMQLQDGHIVLATLRAVNIQVRGQWHAEPSNAFSIYAQDNGQTGILMLTTSLQETKVVTVEVKDMFSYLNPLYEDLAATAFITVQPGVPLPRLLSFTPSTVYIGDKNAKGVVTLVNYKNAVQGCDPQQIYSPALFGEPNILGFPDWLSNYHSKEKFAIESAEYSFDIEPPATPNIYVFSVTANVYCDFPNSADLISFTDNYTLAVAELPLQFTNAPTDFVAAPAGKVAEVYDLDGRGSYDFTFVLIGGGQYVNADGNVLFSLGKDGRLTVHNGVERKELYRAPYLLTVEMSDDRPAQNGGRQAITAALSVVLMTAITNGKNVPGVSGLQGEFVYAAGGQARTLQADEDFDLLPKINSGATLIVQGGSKIAVQSDSFVFVLEPGYEDRLILINGSSLLGLVTSISDSVEGLTAYYGKENLLEGEQGVIYQIGAQFEKLSDKPLFQCIDFGRLGIHEELRYACGVLGEQAQIAGDSAGRRLRTLAGAAVAPLAEEPSNSLRLDFVAKQLTNKPPTNKYRLHFLVTRGSLELPRLLTNYINMPAYGTGRWLLYDIEDNSNILTVAPGPQLPPFAKLTIHAHQDVVMTVTAENVQTQIGWEVLANTDFEVGEFDGVVRGVTQSSLPPGLITLTVQVTDQFSVLRARYTNYLATGQVTIFVWEPLSVLSLPQRLTLSHQQAGSVAAFTASGGDGKYSYTLPQSDKFSLLPGATSAVLSLRVPPQEGPAILAITVTLRDVIGSLPVQAAATVEILSPLSLSLAVADGHVHSEYIGTVARVQGQGGYSDYEYSLVGSAAVFAIDEANGMISIIQAVEGLATLSVTVRVSDKPPLPALPTEAIATMVITVVEAISFGEVPAKLTVIANYWQFLATLEASGGYGDISLSISGDDSFYLTNGTLSYGTLYAAPSGDDEQARMITLVIVADDTGAAVPEAVSIAVAVSAKLAASFATRVRISRQVIGSLGKTQTSGGIAPYTYRLVDGGFSIIGGDGGDEGGGGLPVFGSNYLTVVMTTGQLSVIAKFDGATELTVKWAVNDSDNERTPELTVTTVVEVVDGLVFRSSAGRGYQVELTAQVSGHPERTGALGLFTLFATGADGEVSYDAPIFNPPTVAVAFTVLYDGAGVTVSLTAYLQDEPPKLSINIIVSAQVEGQEVTEEQLLQIMVVQPPPVSLALPLMMTLYDGGDNCCLVAATMTGESGLTPYGYTLFDDSGNLTIVAEENSVVLSLRVKQTVAATLTVSLAVFDAYQPPRRATVKAMVTVLAPLTLSLPAQVRPLPHEIMGLIATLAGMGGDAQYTYTVLHLPHDRYRLTDDHRLSVRLAGENSYSVTVVLMDKIGSTAATAVASVSVLAPLTYAAPDKVRVYSRYIGEVAAVTASGGDGEYIYTASGDEFAIVNNNGEGVLSLTVAYVGLAILTVSVSIADMIGSQATTAKISLIIQPPLELSAPSNIVTVAHMYVGVLATLTAAGGSGAEDSYLYTVAGGKANLVGNDEMATLSLTLAHRGAISFTLTAVLSDTADNRPIEELITVSVLPPLGLLAPATLTISYLQTGVLMILEPSGGRQPYTHQISEQAFTVRTTEAYVPSIDSAGATLTSMVQVYALSITEAQAGLRRPTLTIVLTDAIGSPPLTATMFIDVRSTISASVSVLAIVPSNYTLHVGRIFASGAADYIYSVMSPLSLFAIDADGVISLTAEITGATILYAAVQVRDSYSPLALTLMFTVNMSPPLALTAPDELTLAYRSLPVLATLTMTGGHGEYSFTLSDLSLFTLSIDAAATVAVLSLSVAQESPWHTTLTIVLRDTLGSPPVVAAVTMTALPQLVLPEVFLTIRNSAYSTAPDNRTTVSLQAAGGSGNYVYSLESALTLSVDAATGELFLSKDISGPVTLKIEALVQDPLSLPQAQATANIWLVVNPPLEAAGSAYPLFSGVVDTAGKIKASGAWGRGRDTFSLVRNPDNAFAVQPDGLLVLTLAQPITVLTPVVLVSNGAEAMEVSVEISVQAEIGGGDLYEDGEMLIIGGYRYGAAKQKILSAEVWASDDGITWELRTAAAEFGPRILPEAIQYKGRIWLVGGESADGLAQDIWSSSDGGVTWRRDVEKVPFGDTFGGALVAYNGKMWFLSTSGEVWNTDNGIDWNSVAQGNGYPQRPQGKYFAEAFGIRLLLFAGDGENADIWASSDGADWTRTRNEQNWRPRDGVAIEASRRTEDGLAFNEQIFVMRGGLLNQHDEILVAKGGGDEWDLASHMPSTVGIDAGRQYAGFVFYRGNLYVAGGRRINGELLGDVWRGNRNGLNWKLATGNLGGRSHHAMIVAKRVKLPEFSGLQLGDMYVAGGERTSGQVHRYRHGEWKRLKKNIAGGQYVEMVYYEDALYAHAKHGGKVVSLYVTRDPEKGWNSVANELSDTQIHMVSYDGKIITIQDDKVWFFEDGEWTHRPYKGRAGQDIDLVAHKGLLYALGGYADFQNGPYFDDVWRSADGENWTKINNSSGFPPQAGNFVSDNEYIYLIGGHGIALTTGGLGEGDTATYNLGDDDLGEITQLVLRSTDAIHWVTLYAPKGNIISKKNRTAPWDIGSDQYESDLAVGSDDEIYVVGGSSVKGGFWESRDQAETWTNITVAWSADENQGPGVAVVTNLDATIPAVFILDDVPIIEISSGFHGDVPLVTMEAVGGNQFFKWSIIDDPYNMFDIGKDSGIIYAILGLEGPIPFDEERTFEIIVRADSDLYSDVQEVQVRILSPVSLQARFDTTKGEFTQQEKGIVGNLHWAAGAWGGDERYNFYSLVGNPQSAFAMDGNALVLTVTGMIGGAYAPVVRLSNGGQFVDTPVAVTVLQPAGGLNEGDLFMVGGREVGKEYSNEVWRNRRQIWERMTDNISDLDVEKGLEVAYYQGRLYLLGLGVGKHVLSSADGINWREEAAMPANRTYHTAVPHKGKLVVFGGYVEGEDFSTQDPAVWEFDGEKWSVIHAESFPDGFGRYDFDGVSHRGLLYASGGQNIASFIVGSTPEYYNDVWVSADGGRSWKRVDEDADSKYGGGRGVMLKGIDPDSGAINLYQVRSQGGRATVWSSLAGVEWTQRGDLRADFSDERNDGASDGRKLFILRELHCSTPGAAFCDYMALAGSADGQNWESRAFSILERREYQLVAVPILDAPTPLTFDVPKKWVVVPQNYVGKILTIRAWGGAGVYSYSLLSQQREIFSLDQIGGKISLLQARTSDLIYATVRVESGGQVIERIVQIGSHELSLAIHGDTILVPSNHGGKPFYTAEAEGGSLPYTYRINPVIGQQNQVHITPQGELFIPLVKLSEVQSQKVIVEVRDAAGNSAETEIQISVPPLFSWAGVAAINEVIPYNEERKLWAGAGKNFPSGGLPFAGAQPYLFSIGVFTSTPGDHNLSVDAATGDIWKVADGWSGNLYRQQVQITLIWSDALGNRLLLTRNIEVGGRLRLEWDSDRQSIPSRYAGVIGTLSLQPTDYPAGAVNYYTDNYNFDVSADGAMIANPAPFGPATVVIQVWAENDVLSSASRMLTIKIDAPIKVGASNRAAADHEFLPMASAAENLMMPPRNEEPPPSNILWLSLGSRCFDDAAKMTAWQNWVGCGAV